MLVRPGEAIDKIAMSGCGPESDVSARLDAGRPRVSPAGDDPLLDLVHRRALDAVVTVIGLGLAFVADRPAPAHFDQLGTETCATGRAVGWLGHRAGVVLVQHDQVAAF